jgi:hypothetical protein
VSKRSVSEFKAPLVNQITDSEKILIRALASATEMQTSEERISSRDGTEEEFDPARQAQFALRSERLHEGLATELLIEALLKEQPESVDILQVELLEGDRNLLATILMKEEEELSAERVEGAVRALRRIQLRRKLERLQIELLAARGLDPERVEALVREKTRLKLALNDPGMAGDSIANSA